MAAPGTSSSLARVWKVSRTLALSSPPRVADPVLPPAVVPVVEAAPDGGAVDDAGASVGVDVHPVIANAAAVAMPNAMRRRDGTCQVFLGLLLVTVDSQPTLIIALNLPQRRREIYPRRRREMAANAYVPRDARLGKPHSRPNGHRAGGRPMGPEEGPARVGPSSSYLQSAGPLEAGYQGCVADGQRTDTMCCHDGVRPWGPSGR